MNENVEKIKQQLKKKIYGKDEVIDKILRCLLAGGHVLLDDNPGVGKTTLAKALAESIGCEFSRIQFTPDTLASDITGMSIYNMDTKTFQYHKGSVMCNVLLADEINRTSPKTQAALLEAMQEGQVTVDGKTYPLPKPFFVVATQNQTDHRGTYFLPEAQLDRFMIQLSIGYPDFEAECEMARAYLGNRQQGAIEAAIDLEQLLKLQEEVAKVVIHDSILQYAANIASATRKNQNIALGASPRSLILFLKYAQATAYSKGRSYVIPEDMKENAKDVLAHRLILSPQAVKSGKTKQSCLDEILGRVKAPKGE